MPAKRPDPRGPQSVAEVVAALDEGTAPDSEALRIAARHLLQLLAIRHPGHTLEVRVPPVAAVQCMEGPRHTRGTPPNTIETDPVTWVRLATGRLDWADAIASAAVQASGARASLAAYLPLVGLVSGRSGGRLPPGRLHTVCGVFGVWAPGEDVAKLAYYGLYALQHRGQESAGIAVSDGNRIVVHKEMGLVAQAFDEPALTALRGHLAVGHCRYSTTGASVWANAQPTFRSTPAASLALGHNGNLINTRELAALLEGQSGIAGVPATSDTDVLTALFVSQLPGVPGGVENTAAAVLPLARGAYSLVFMDEHALYAARDPHGFRPLVLGRLAGDNGGGCGGAEELSEPIKHRGERSELHDRPAAEAQRTFRPDDSTAGRVASGGSGESTPRENTGWVVASETAALDIVGAKFEREIAPGELIRIDSGGVRSRKIAEPTVTGCLFEHVYLARPDTTISGRGVHATRVQVGKRLAAEHPVDADLVIPVPESGTPAAIGFAEASKIPFGQGLVKNSYVGRTFIQPSQTIRQRGIKLKLNPLREAIAGKRIVVVDDSIVRGNTQRALVAMLREAGAVEVHVRVASPPVISPCFFGIDFATRDELIAGSLTTEEIRASIGADSLGYVSLEGLTEATTLPADRLCRACFDGRYPVPVANDDRGKYVLEVS